jgi:Tfp pilus assembly protein PilO
MWEHDPLRRLKWLGACLHAVGFLLLLAMVGAGYFLVLRPLDAEIADRQSRAATLEDRLKDVDVFRTEHQRLMQLATQHEQKNLAIAKRVPDEPLEAQFLAQVAAAAGQSGLKLGNFRPGVVRVRDGHSQMEIQLSCLGPYRGLCGFLDRLSSLERLSRVAQMEVSAGASADCPATVTLVIFFHLTKPPEAKPLEGRPLEAKPRTAQQGGAIHG